VGTLAFVHGAWRMVDLQVYRLGGHALITNRDLYSVHLGPLAFTYPPFAAVLMTPAAALPLDVGRVLIVLATAGALGAMVWPCTSALKPSSRDVRFAMAAVLWTVSLWSQPVRETLWLGQINVILAAMIIVDLTATRHRPSQGVLIGIAAGIKLTPAIFAVYLLLTGRIKAALTSFVTFLATVGVGFAVVPSASWHFWTKLVFNPEHVGGVAYVSNQSIMGLLTRAVGSYSDAKSIWLPAALVVATAGLYLATRASRRGQEILAIGLVGLTGTLVSPISWSHHWVWTIPLTVGLVAVTRETLGVLRIGMLAAWAAIFVVGPIWWAPDSGHSWTLAQSVVGNAYVILAAGLFLAFVILAIGDNAADRSPPVPD